MYRGLGLCVLGIVLGSAMLCVMLVEPKEDKALRELKELRAEHEKLTVIHGEHLKASAQMGKILEDMDRRLQVLENNQKIGEDKDVRDPKKK